MKTFKVLVTVYSLVGPEKREIVVKARTMVAAEKKVIRLMGNRDYHVHNATEQK